MYLVVREFCKISIEFIRKGANRRVYQAAARKLQRIMAIWAMVRVYVESAPKSDLHYTLRGYR